MLSLFSFLSLFFLVLPTYDAAITRPFKCAVCEAFVTEMNSSMLATKEQHLVQTRWRIDDKRHIPYYRTEFRLMEIIENEIEGRMNEYGESHYTKETEYIDTEGKPYFVNETFVRLVKREDERAYYVQNYTYDDGVKRRVKKVWRRWVEELEEPIVMVFHREEDMSVVLDRVCREVVKVCTRILEHPPLVKKPQPDPVPEPVPETTTATTTTQTTEPTEPVSMPFPPSLKTDL